MTRLLRCPACRHRVSAAAAACPGCGHPLADDQKFQAAAARRSRGPIALLVALTVLICAGVTYMHDREEPLPAAPVPPPAAKAAPRKPALPPPPAHSFSDPGAILDVLVPLGFRLVDPWRSGPPFGWYQAQSVKRVAGAEALLWVGGRTRDAATSVEIEVTAADRRALEQLRGDLHRAVAPLFGKLGLDVPAGLPDAIASGREFSADLPVAMIEHAAAKHGGTFVVRLAVNAK